MKSRAMHLPAPWLVQRAGEDPDHRTDVVGLIDVDRLGHHRGLKVELQAAR